MYSKSSRIEHHLLQAIRSGEYPVGSLIPSRAKLTRRFDCSRVTVERAIAKLVQAGYLNCRQGSGTYVKNADLNMPVKEVLVVSGSNVLTNENRFFSHFMVNTDYVGLPMQWLSYDKLIRSVAELKNQSTAIIWVLPGYEQLGLMNILQERGVPQLIINRNFDGFDCVRTDQLNSLREGLAFLMLNGRSKLTVLGRECTLSRAYQPERLSAFHTACVELGIRLRPDGYFIREYFDPAAFINELGPQIFRSDDEIPAICVLNSELTLPLVMYAHRCGKTVGKDFRLLTFDYFAELAKLDGVGMMLQAWGYFAREIRRWLESGAALSPERFDSAIKAELIVNTDAAD